MSTSLEKSINSKMLSVDGYIFAEGWTSIAYSQDKRGLSNIGRLGRMGIERTAKCGQMTAKCCQYGYFSGDLLLSRRRYTKWMTR